MGGGGVRRKVKQMRYRPAAGATACLLLRANAKKPGRARWGLRREGFSAPRSRFQVPLRMFTADFARHRAKRVIQVDGGQHGPDGDARRAQPIEAEDCRILRSRNHEVPGNRDGVRDAIAKALHGRHPHPDPPPSRGREI